MRRQKGLWRCQYVSSPGLLDYLSNRDETEDSLRIPISLGIATIAMHLPAGPKERQITRLLTVLSQALRSRSQDTRDLVRETMCRIVIMLGPSYLSYVVRGHNSTSLPM